MNKQTNRTALAAVVVWAAALGMPAKADTASWDWPVGMGVVAPQWGAATTTGKKKSNRQKNKQLATPERMPNGESVTTRERRLLRECKGRPNAGACLGYAS